VVLPSHDGEDAVDSAQREQRILDAFGEVEALDRIEDAIGATAKETKETQSDVRRVLVERGRVPIERLASSYRIEELGARHREVLVDAEVRGISEPMLVPSRVVATCKRCGTSQTRSVDSVEYVFASTRRRDALLKPLECSEELGGCKRPLGETSFSVEVKRRVNYHRLQVASYVPPASATSEFSDVELPMHLLQPAETDVVVPPRALFFASVEPDPKTLVLSLVSELFKPLDVRPEPRELGREERDLFLAMGTSRNSTRLRLFDEVAPDIIGRDTAKEAILLVLHSIAKIRNVKHDEIAGVLYAVYFGDSGTAKTALVDDVTIGLGLGQGVDAAAASRAGLTFTHKEVAGLEYIEYGAFPKNHLGLLTLNGVEAWSPELQMQLRDVLANHRVVVQMKLKGARPAYVRTLMTANPRLPMSDYPWPASAIREIPAFARPPDVRRIPFWIPFAEEDTPAATIAEALHLDRPWPAEAFRRHVFWTWTRRVDDVHYTEDADRLIREEMPRLLTRYGAASLPIVNLGYLDVLCSVSVAEACLAFSTTTGVDVLVTHEHVASAVDFLERMFALLRLDDYRRYAEDEVQFVGGESLQTCIDIGSRPLAILVDLAVKDHLTSDEVAAKYGVHATSVAESDFRVLREHGLIETLPGVGAMITTRGMKLANWVTEIEHEGE